MILLPNDTVIFQKKGILKLWDYPSLEEERERKERGNGLT